MSRTKQGWIGGLEPLSLAVDHSPTHVLVGITNKEGHRIAVELRHDQASMLALIGRQEEERPPVMDAEFEVNGRLFVSDTFVGVSCEPTIDRWEGPIVPIRMQFEEQPRRLLWSARDPSSETGFVLKLTERARGTLFAAIAPTRNIQLRSACSIEGDLEVTQ